MAVLVSGRRPHGHCRDGDGAGRLRPPVAQALRCGPVTLGALVPAAGLVPVRPAFPRQCLLVVPVVAVSLPQVRDARASPQFGTGPAPVGAIAHVVHQPGGVTPSAGMPPGSVLHLADLPAGSVSGLTAPVAAMAGQVVGVQGAVAAERLAGAAGAGEPAAADEIPAGLLNALDALADLPRRPVSQGTPQPAQEVAGLSSHDSSSVIAASAMAGGVYGGAMGARRGASIAGCGTGARTSAGKSAGNAGS